jgi:hypothetical protein
MESEMNAVEIADEVLKLSEKPFDPVEFPFEFLAAFGNKETTITRLRRGDSNVSDIEGGVLQKNNIHLAVCEGGAVRETLRKLKASPKTASAKAKFVLSTDGETLEAEELKTSEPLACDFAALADHFGFFLPLAGISTVKEIKENPIDVRATGRLNKLYVELLRTNEDWQTEERRTDLNHFFARLIFCFFAEDTRIFHGDGMFTDTVARMSNPDGSNVDFVLAWLFKAMNLNLGDRKKLDLPLWADKFPYVNGGLFSDDLPMPRFTRTARSYLLRAGELNWREINPDIFGSMIQAVADDEERDNLGMHYTSVPNILKVLIPLFLDDLREQLEKAGEHKASLLKLRERMSRIRVFDPACGSGNFLVIAYKEMRKVEAEINRRRGEVGRTSEIPPTNFRGIEIRDFAAEVARLALVIAEYQCDVLHRGERLALAEFLPLNKENWIYKGNALRLDWTTVCPPTGTGVKVQADDLFGTELEQAEIDFTNVGGETYLCGNPPYYGSRRQQDEQKEDLRTLAGSLTTKWKSLDYVAGWFIKASSYAQSQECRFAFVCTSSLCEGLQVPLVWPHILRNGLRILFAHKPFAWANLAQKNAGVTVVIVGVGRATSEAELFDMETVRLVHELNPYLVPGKTTYVQSSSTPISSLPKMVTGAMPRDGGNLLLCREEVDEFTHAISRHGRHSICASWLRPYLGSAEIINGGVRFCLWIPDDDSSLAKEIPWVEKRLAAVSEMRSQSPLDSTRAFANQPHRFVYLAGDSLNNVIGIPSVSSERREFLPVDLLKAGTIVSNLAFALYDPPLWCLALVASRLHLVWIASVCGKLKTDYRYSNTLGWNTFPIPVLTQHDKDALTRCAEEILLARETHFPATIADLYAQDAMPANVRRAHDKNNETLERIYVGRRFRNDTERLEKLFELYSSMTAREKTGIRTARAKA